MEPEKISTRPMRNQIGAFMTIWRPANIATIPQRTFLIFMRNGQKKRATSSEAKTITGPLDPEATVMIADETSPGTARSRAFVPRRHNARIFRFRLRRRSFSIPTPIDFTSWWARCLLTPRRLAIFWKVTPFRRSAMAWSRRVGARLTLVVLAQGTSSQMIGLLTPFPQV